MKTILTAVATAMLIWLCLVARQSVLPLPARTPSRDHRSNGSNAEAWIFYGDGHGHFRKTLFSRGIGFHEVRVADLNGDGLLDILDKPYNWETTRVDVWLQKRDHAR